MQISKQLYHSLFTKTAYAAKDGLNPVACFLSQNLPLFETYFLQLDSDLLRSVKQHYARLSMKLQLFSFRSSMFCKFDPKLFGLLQE